MQLLDWFTVLASISFLESLHSLRGGLQFLKMVRKVPGEVLNQYCPPVTLVVPCRGLEPGLYRNLQAFLNLDYPDHQLLLVTDDPADASVPVILSLLKQYPYANARILFSGKAYQRSQKVHNLIHAVGYARIRDQVLAFGDSDIRPHRQWLRYLVSTLREPGVGVSTGFRWYIPQNKRFSSVLRSVWNAGVVTLMKERDCHFAWGGAMAIRKEVFESCGVLDYWKHSLSDDFSLSYAVKASGRSIHFQPRCLSFSYEDSTLLELLRWSHRQLTITRIYRPALWGAVFVSQVLNLVVIFLGGTWALCSMGTQDLNRKALILLVLVGFVFGSGSIKSWFRVRAVSELFPEVVNQEKGSFSPYIFWGPLAALISVVGMLSSLFTRKVRWRGITYRMVSPSETLVLGEKEQ